MHLNPPEKIIHFTMLLLVIPKCIGILDKQKRSTCSVFDPTVQIRKRDSFGQNTPQDNTILPFQ